MIFPNSPLRSWHMCVNLLAIEHYILFGGLKEQIYPKLIKLKLMRLILHHAQPELRNSVIDVFAKYFLTHATG